MFPALQTLLLPRLCEGCIQNREVPSSTLDNPHQVLDGEDKQLSTPNNF
jgi:hypothetical protein